MKPITVLSNKRKNKIKTRWNEIDKLCKKGQSPVDVFKILFTKTEASNFLTNRTQSKNPKYKDFKVDFNWLMKNDDNYVKVLEGQYDNKDTNNNSHAEKLRQQTAAAARRGVD
ncbi:hypothetical protein [Halocella sp. SP3-1]|uniref:hypothetical protein n=1 Tax=Halocella sp. SP3-1 TaxID=2382161 RepID=UPI000F751689|nr:hypothetical protein [Halocella sp. SP3-1]AZO96170.1 hypothetical protein D7D81_17100 [Halocella sp. SP3-1]